MLRLLLRYLPGLCLSGVALLLLAAGIGRIMPEYTLVYGSNRYGWFDFYLLAVPYRLTRQLTWQHEIAGSADWSPDGQTLIYTTLNHESYDIAALNIITLQQTILVDHPTHDTDAAWSPDGSKIVFTSNRASISDLYTLELATGVVTRLDNHPGRDIDPQWSPDGSRIAYISNRDRGFDSTDMNVQILDLATLTSQPQRSSFVSSAAVWSPDGASLTFAATQAGTMGRNPDIFQLDLTTQKTNNLVSHPRIDAHPAWSVDGKWLVFTSDRDDGNYELYMMELLLDAQTGEVQRLTFNSVYDYLPVWRP